MTCCSERKDDSPCYECLLESVQRVRELHKPNKYNECERCSEHTCWGCQEWSDCLNCECPCHGTYPCDTIKALDGEQ